MKKHKFIWMAVGLSAFLTLMVYLVSLTFTGIDFLPDTGATWYYWKLPNPTFVTRLTAWGGYIAHQLFLWGMILKIARSKEKKTGGLTSDNKVLIVGNLFFIGLHMIQSFIWYDGLAQDVSVASSQYSVIVMLVLVLIMENRRRGLFFGKKVPLPKDGVNRVMKFHGFFIAWAITYTFWYHPMEGTAGHLFGFFYMYLLFAEVSLAGTKYHLNRIWTFLLEITVLFHGTTVAILQKNGMWSMFFFGFATMFIVTQMYGLGLSKGWKIGLTVLYGAFAIFTYSGVYFDKSLVMIHQVTWIPIILYGLVFVISYGLQIPSLFNKEKQVHL